MRRMIAAGPPAKRPPHIGFAGASGCFATVALVLLCALSPAAAADDQAIRLGEFIPVATPQPAPQAQFTDLDGKSVSLADFQGKPAIINLWATWCRPCLKEMPSLDRLQAGLKGKLAVAAVSQDRGGADKVEPFVKSLGLESLQVYVDPTSGVGHAFGARGLPTSIVIDARGRVVGRVEGAAEWDSETMRAVLRPLLTTIPEL